MIDALQKISDTLESIRDDIPGLLGEVLEENAELILDLNRLQLLDRKLSDGSDTLNGSQLYRSGRFHRELKLSVFQDYATIYDSVPYAPLLERRYSDKIYGVAPEHMPELLDQIILPALQKKIAAKLITSLNK